MGLMLPSVHLKLHDARQLIANALFLRLVTGMLPEMRIRSSGVSEPSSLYFTQMSALGLGRVKTPLLKR